MNKFIFIICTFLPFLFDGNADASNHSTTEFNRPVMTFDMTVHNPSYKAKHLVKVGVASKAEGNFQCLSGAEVLTPLADYIVPFHVKTPKTVIKADPPLRIDPKKSARFTISIQPSAIGSCGFWSATVSAIAIFDDGTELVTLPEQVSAQDVISFNQRIPPVKELLEALKSKNSRIRGQAVNKLPNVKIARDEAEVILDAKLSDKDSWVQTKAVRATGKLGLSSLLPKLLSLLKTGCKTDYGGSPDGDTLAAALPSTLASLGSAIVIEPLLQCATIEDSNGMSSSAFEALKKIEYGDAPFQVRKLLESRKAWAIDGSGWNKKYSYLRLCELAIAYRDVKAVPHIRSLIKATNSHGDRLLINLLRELETAINGNCLMQTPFFIELKPDVQAALSIKDKEVQDYASRYLSHFK